MPEDNPMTEADLKQLTNEAFGEPSEQPAPTAEPSPEPEPPVAVAPPEPKGQAQPDPLKSLFDDTPYKGDDVMESARKLVEGYKNIQSEYSKQRDKVKPYEQLLDDVAKDSGLANFIEQARMLYRNPQLASAYATQTGHVDAPPDPRTFDMYDPTQYEAYQKALSDYNARQLDGRINARFSQIEQQQRIEKMKSELKLSFPDANPDDVLAKVQQKGTAWNLVDAYKALDYDNLKSKALDEARKEIKKQLETAKTSGTPTPSAAPKTAVNIEDIVNHIAKFGGVSAEKKFGKKAVTDAMRESSAF